MCFSIDKREVAKGWSIVIAAILPSSERKIGSERKTSICGWDRRRIRLRSADAKIMAAIWPERCSALVSVSGHPIGSQQAGNANTSCWIEPPRNS